MNHSEKTILITGGSSGIGRTVSIYLAKKGYTVLSTVRKASDASELERLSIDTLHPVFPLDLRNENQISQAIVSINKKISEKEIPPLCGIMFVAGKGRVTPVELMNTEDFRDELEVRLTGPVKMLQGLLPRLRETKGRILWIATPALLPAPFVAEIHAPDFAVNYLARTLNIELKDDGIRNILIRCGGIETPSYKKSEKNLFGQIEGFPPERKEIYKERLEKEELSLKNFSRKRTPATKVAETVYKALKSKHPKIRYQVGHLSKAGAILEILPQKAVDIIMSKIY